MSQRPSEQDPSGKPTNDGRENGAAGQRRSSPPPNSSTTRSISGPRSISATPPIAEGQLPNLSRDFERPRLPPTSDHASERSLPSVTRIGGVSSILNPPYADEAQPSLRRKASHLESSASLTQSLPPILSGTGAHQTSVPSLAHSPVSHDVVPSERPPRRILTPRSPSLHRAASLGQLNPSAGTISAQTTPFPASPRGRPYTIEPGRSGAPPLPTPPAIGRPGYGFPGPPAPTEAARRASTGGARARRLSASASSSTSYSSYSQTGHTSPAVQYDPMSLSTLSAPYMATAEAATAPPTTVGPGHHGQMGIPISSSGGHNTYQMLTLETASGTVQLPVDVQAASRVADEKRRRNAGASARFRQRRKEKEKEAATSISRLEQQVKDLNEDAEFYRRERDFLASALSHIPGGERHFPRPSSPRNRRPSIAPLSGRESRGYTPVQEQGPRSPGEGRNVRRRTSTFSLPHPPQQQSQVPAQGMSTQPGFGPYPSSLQSPSGAVPSPLSRGPLPLPLQIPQAQTLQQPPGPPQVLQAMPQTGPYNPYDPERRASGPTSQQRGPR